MATYTPRPDGLVDVKLDDGRALPMTEPQAQAGGATPEPPPLAPSLPPPDLGGNPFSMVGSGQAVAGPGGGDIAALYGKPQGAPPPPAQISPDDFRRAVGAAPPPPPGSHGGPPAPGGEDFRARPSNREREGQAAPPGAFLEPYATSEGKALGTPTAEPSAEGPTDLQAIDPNAAAQGEGGYQLGSGSGGRLVQTSAGGDRRDSFVKRPGVEADPAYQAVVDSIDPAKQYEEHKAAAQQAFDLRQAALSAEETRNTTQQIANEIKKDEIAANRARLQEKLGVVDQREREAAQATPQSRGEIMASRGTMANVMSGISMIIGAYYQGKTGRNNPGMDMINKALQDEIDGQRAKYEAAKDKISQANTDFGKAMQLYGDPNVAEADLYNRGLTLAANIAQNHWKTADNPIELQKQMEAAQTLREAAGEKKQAAYTLLHGQVLQENWKHHDPTFAAVGGNGYAGKPLKDSERERLVHVPGYGYGFVVAGPARDEFQKAATASGDALDIGDQILSKLPKGGGATWDPNDRATVTSLGLRLLPSISLLEKQGTVTKADAENMEAGGANINAFAADNGAALRATLGIIRRKLHNSVRDSMYADPNNTIPMVREGGRAQSFKPGL